jgi:hypothetical protein
MKSPRETSPSTSLDKLYLVSPHPGSKDSGSNSGLAPGLASGSLLPIHHSTSASSSNTSALSPNLLDVQTYDQTLHPDRSATYPPTTLPPRLSPRSQERGLRRPKSSVGLGLGTGTSGTSANVGASGGGGSGSLTRFHPFARSDGHGRSRGGSGSGSRSGSRSGPDLGSGTRSHDTGNEDKSRESGTGMGMLLDVGNLLSPNSRIPDVTRAQAGYGHTSSFSLHSVGSMDCPSTSGTGTTSEEESICSPGDETPVAGLPLTIIGPNAALEESGHEEIAGKKVWGEAFPRAWGRTLSGSSSSGGSDGGGEGGSVAGSSGRRKNARGLRIDIRRTFSVGQQAGVKRQAVPVDLDLAGKGDQVCNRGKTTDVVHLSQPSVAGETVSTTLSCSVVVPATPIESYQSRGTCQATVR